MLQNRMSFADACIHTAVFDVDKKRMTRIAYLATIHHVMHKPLFHIGITNRFVYLAFELTASEPSEVVKAAMQTIALEKVIPL